ncbi:hypothetical protein EXN22_01450 [Pseudomonas tructae]|uniref:Uncharacterized protein n=1 Tax=Pseudomonas tructae TaxID=2518644 RepID=A0A411MCK9_9PSED|nr:hypothetical protein [Pseudomonas tructae]QBF24409.1 hypothetical protein EXN22_01450 [Pseudomonas tructae]
MQKGIEKVLKQSPGFKAKEIAKELGLNKAGLNSALHASDVFVQDSEYRWYRACDVRLRISPTAIWINGNHVESALTRFRRDYNPDCKKILIEIGEENSILLDGAAKVLAIANQEVHAGNSVEIKFGSPDMHSYLARAQFFDRLHAEVLVTPPRPEKKVIAGGSSKLVEFHEIGGPFDSNVASKIKASLEQNASDQALNVDAVQYAISELVSNVQEHSQTPNPGFAGLQCYGGTKPHIMMVVSDNGLGICGTLQPILARKYPHLADEFDAANPDAAPKLIIKAFTEGGLSQMEDDGRGTGLRTSGRQAATLDAKMLIRQDNFEVTLRYKDGALKDCSTRLHLSRLSGTHVMFSFYLTKTTASD